MIARITARIVALTLFVLLAAGQLCAADAPSISLDNEFIRVVVNKGPAEAGRFSVRTTGGDPSRPASQNKHLIFGGNSPWTSYTTVLIDGVKYAFGGATTRRAGQDAKYGKEVTPPTLKDGKIVCTYDLGDILVTQEIGFVRGLSTRMLDTAGISYKLVNKGTEPHKVGLRVMLDTMCGPNDGAPICAGRPQPFTAPTSLDGNAIVDSWQAFDTLAEPPGPTVIAQGTLKGGATTPPDKVIFADWGSLADESWEPAKLRDSFGRKDEETETDTASAMLWNPVELEPEQSRTITTYYGMGYRKLIVGKLTLGINKPAETTFQHERTQPFTVSCIVQNAGAFEAQDVTVSLTLPEGLTLVGDGKLKENLKSLKPGEFAEGSWLVQANGKAGGKLKLQFDAVSKNIEETHGEDEILVNVPKPKMQFTPATQRVPLTTNRRSTIVIVKLNLTPAENFHGVRYVLTYDPNVLSALSVSRGTNFIENGRMLAWEFDDTEEGKIVVTGRRLGAPALTQAEANLATITFRTEGVGKTALKLEKAVLLTDKEEERPVDVDAAEVEVIAEPQK